MSWDSNAPKGNECYCNNGPNQEGMHWSCVGGCGCRGPVSAAEQAEHEAKKAKETFDAFDKDGDGGITEKEAREALKAQGMPDEEIDASIDRALGQHDLDKDKKLNFDEFKNLMATPPAEPKETEYVKNYEYAGKQNKTVSGRACQSWDSQSPHKQGYY